MEFTIYSPSISRQGRAIVHKYLSSVKYVIGESQLLDYRKTIPIKNLEPIPDSNIGAISDVKNYILDNMGENIILIDDDIRRIGIWNIVLKKNFSEKEAYNFIYNSFCMANDGGFHFWGVNADATCNRNLYRDYQPISFKKHVSGGLTGHIKNPCRYNGRFRVFDEYDMTLQVLCKYRRLLRFDFAFYDNDFHKKLDDKMSIADKIIFIEELQKKWGKRIVKKPDAKNMENIAPLINPSICGV